MKKVYFAFAAFAACTNAQAIDLVTNGDVTLSLGGYVEAEGVYTFDDEGVYTKDGTPEKKAEDKFDGTAKQSRINLKTTKMINNQKVTGFVEGDFYGSGNTTFRLRHAYIQADKYTLGKTWSGQFLAVYPQLTEQIDFVGTALGTIGAGNVRPDLVLHYANNGLRLTAQDPYYNQAHMPDLVASYTGKAGNLGYNIAATARDAQTGANDSDIGLGASLAGHYKLGKGSIHASAFTGEGLAPYSAVGSDAESGDLVSQMGYTVGYKHQLTDKVRGNIRYGKVEVDDKADTSMEVMSVNALYKYSPEIDFGIEWRKRTNETKSTSASGNQIEVMAQYRF